VTSTIATVVAASVVAVVGVIVALQRIFGAQKRPFNGETKEIVSLLREVRDHLVGMGYEQRAICAGLTRVEQSQVALHRRLDSRGELVE
jgi:hypothetical protein